MKSTGVVRRIDELGRIVIPIEFRRTHNIDIRDPLQIHSDGTKIILTKYEETCHFCSSTKDVRIYKSKKICSKCLKAIATLV